MNKKQRLFGIESLTFPKNINYHLEEVMLKMTKS